LTPRRTIISIIDKVTIFCNDVNKTSTYIEVLVVLINILHYRSQRSKIDV